MPPLDRFRRLDVRRLLARGIEPLPPVPKPLAAPQDREGFRPPAPFLPSPLIELLGGQGFASKIERGDASDWLVFIWRAVP